jgi:hypothetical protein
MIRENALWTIVSIVLTELVYLQKMEKNMPLRGPALSCPLMPLADQHLCAQTCPSWTSTLVPTQVLQATHKQTKSAYTTK